MRKPTIPLKNVEKRRVPAQRRAQQSVERIFDATKSLIDAVGIDRLSTNRIAEAAGMSTGALYNFFPNKESILFAIVEAWLAKIRGTFRSTSPKHHAYATAYEWIDNVALKVEADYRADPLVAKYYNALTGIPDLKKLDAQHDDTATEILVESQLFFAADLDKEQAVANSRAIVQMMHGVFANALDLEPSVAAKMRRALRHCLCSLAGRYLHLC